MNPRILTLFGEETVPEALGAAGTLKPESGHTQEALALSADWKPEKQYYTIGEVAELFGVKASNIRFWTNEFALKVRTTRKGDRLYSPANMQELQTIYHLVKDRGFTISGAKAKMSGKTSIHQESINPTATTDLRKSLLQLRNQLLTIRNQLK